MKFLSAACSDVGIRKKINQDALVIRSMVSKGEEILLAAVCDGMGGLEKGEVASAEMVRAFARWFDESLPSLLSGECERKELSEKVKKKIEKSLKDFIQKENALIWTYGKQKKILLGTTVSAVLLVFGWYLIVQIGDSRVYALTDNVKQLTKDQTYVQREVDAGRLTREQAEKHPQKHVLLQCVGVQKEAAAEFYFGKYNPGVGFLICSDGFYNQILPGELQKRFCRKQKNKEKDMEETLKKMIELDKKRMELDNISAIWILTG